MHIMREALDFNVRNLKTAKEIRGRFRDHISDDELYQLAKDNMCPHYRFINPVTKSEIIYFISQEIREWTEKHFLRGYKGTDFKPHQFIYLTNDYAPSLHEIPIELLKINGLQKLPLEFINTPSGIYFLCRNKKIVYIGQAINIAGRICSHLTEKRKEFDSCFFICCPVNKLNEIEGSLITHYKPEYNKTALNGSWRDPNVLSNIFKETSVS